MRAMPSAVLAVLLVTSVAAEAPRSNAWMEEEGIRAIWFGYKLLTDEMAEALNKADVNTAILSYGFHDLLDLESLRWGDSVLKGELRKSTCDRLLKATHTAAEHGIHVFWMANYELSEMLPHLRRLGYHAAYVEGPTRYVPAGAHEDAAALDPVFWRGIAGLHVEHVARLSLGHPIEGTLYDTEHYDGGIMYLQGSGFADVSYRPFAAARGLDEWVAAGERYTYLKAQGQLTGFRRFLEEQAYEQGCYLAERCHAINPHLVLGVWPTLENWFSEGYLRGLGGAVRSLGFSGVEYYHGADQTKSLARLFESRSSNLLYMAGFYPPYAYTTAQLETHVGKALRDTGSYWMLSGHEQIVQPAYQAALIAAAKSARLPMSRDKSVGLSCRVVETGGQPELLVTAESTGTPLEGCPRLTLRAALGGAALCDNLTMTLSEDGRHEAHVPLMRRLSNNANLGQGFRAGVKYRCEPQPLDHDYPDCRHTKLFDGMAYGYFSTTLAWPREVAEAEIVLDLQRDYQVDRVVLAQPFKLEDRVGGPSKLAVSLATEPGAWEGSFGFQQTPSLSGDDPDVVAEGSAGDPVYSRAWLAWRTEPIGRKARWLRLSLTRTKANAVISLGEVVIWGRFSGDVEAFIHDDRERVGIAGESRHAVP